MIQEQQPTCVSYVNLSGFELSTERNRNDISPPINMEHAELKKQSTSMDETYDEMSKNRRNVEPHVFGRLYLSEKTMHNVDCRHFVCQPVAPLPLPDHSDV